MYELLDAIDNGLNNRYKVVDGYDNTLFVRDRETGKGFIVIVKEETE